MVDFLQLNIVYLTVSAFLSVLSDSELQKYFSDPV
jgi:hypothetical protein